MNKLFKTIIVILTPLIIIAAIFLIKNRPPTDQQNNLTGQQADFNSLLPGKSTNKEVKKVLGDPLEINDTESILFYVYESTNPNINHEIELNKNDNKIKLIREIVSPIDNKNTEEIITKYGKTNLIYYDKTQTGYSIPGSFLYIYPNNGLAYVGHPGSTVMVEVWYFEPTDIDTFLETYAKDYIEADPGLLKLFND